MDPIVPTDLDADALAAIEDAFDEELVDVGGASLRLDDGLIPEKYRKNVDSASPLPMRLMAAKAMLPMSPKDMVHVVYQLTHDPEAKIAAIAAKTLASFDDRILGGVLADPSLAPQVLSALAHHYGDNAVYAEKILLNRAVPDQAFAAIASVAKDAKIIGIVTANQERLLRDHDIVRALKFNEHVLRSDLDRAIDFLVREGVFLADIPEFEDAFLRLGKSEMLAALKDVKVPDNLDYVDEPAVQVDDDGEKIYGPGEYNPNLGFHQQSIPVQMKLGLSGKHEWALQALDSQNRLVAVAGITNPKINESDVQKLIRKRSMHEDVIRAVCRNKDWTKSYTVKLGLVQHPKTPQTMVMRWMTMLRASDLAKLAKSKQIPSAVAMQAKRLMQSKNRR